MAAVRAKIRNNLILVSRSRESNHWLETQFSATPVIVLIAGMPRSGSTFSFNVAREILSARGSVYQEASEDVVGVVGRSDGADHVLVKNHNLDEPSLALARAGAMRIIMTVRRVEDAMASWFDTFDAVPEPIALSVMHHWIRLFQHLRTKALIIPYEQIDRRPWLAYGVSPAPFARSSIPPSFSRSLTG